jgi:hypothetical protein
MSYPLPIRPLIIEDNIDVKEAYTRIFREISGQLPWSLLPAIEPCFALSFEDGRTQLETTSVAFHLVILDLELPQKYAKIFLQAVAISFFRISGLPLTNILP